MDTPYYLEREANNYTQPISYQVKSARDGLVATVYQHEFARKVVDQFNNDVKVDKLREALLKIANGAIPEMFGVDQPDGWKNAVIALQRVAREAL